MDLREPLPQAPVPMLATLGELPTRDEGWTHEFKWDGVRAVVAVVDGRVVITSRNRLDVTVSYPELQPLAAQLGPASALLDGEIVRVDASGRPSFAALQGRMHVSSPARAAALAQAQPVVLLLFDLLHLDGRSLRELPLTVRRELLEALELEGPTWRTPPPAAATGADALAASQQLRLEGVVSKRAASTYAFGRRSRDWVKVKNVRTQEVVVGGWTPGRGRRAATLGSLLLGLPGPRGLQYVGHVGTGFSEPVLVDLLDRLRGLEVARSPFTPPVPGPDAREAHWVRPEMVGEVGFGEWTPDDRLRHPRWRGLRPDKAPDDVVRES